MDLLHGYFMDEPSTYQIRISGQIEDGLVEHLWGMSSSREQASDGNVSVLEGRLLDQAALLGVINALYNMGYAVLSITRIVDKGEV